jgi:hypothetical protein
MSDWEQKAAEYRRIAKEARALARVVGLADARQELLETARQHEELAETED